MRKLVLGKGLRALLHGTSVPGEPENPGSSEGSPDQTAVSPGVGSLLRGDRKAPKEEDPEAPPPHFDLTRLWQNWRLIKWVLLAGDLLLLSLASLLVLKNPSTLSLSESVLCLSALAVGAALALLAVLGHRGR